MIIVLQDGRVAEQGSHEELMKIQGGVYRRLWEAQLTENTQMTEGWAVSDADVEEVVVRKE